jgi:hypothetical protein
MNKDFGIDGRTSSTREGVSARYGVLVEQLPGRGTEVTVPTHRWEDGQPVETVLDKPDRWLMHSADQIQVEFGDEISILVNQKV